MRIIVVEDEMTTRNGIVNLIGRISPAYQVIATAAEGADGLEKICALRPDLVIADIVMPGINGIEMIQRAQERGVKCEFVLLSGHNDFTFAQAAIHLGVREYLLKPLTRSSIEAMLEKAELSIVQKQYLPDNGEFNMTARERSIYLQLKSGSFPTTIKSMAWPLLICFPAPCSTAHIEAMRQSFRVFNLFGQADLYLLPSNDVYCVQALVTNAGTGSTWEPAVYLKNLADMLLRACPDISFVLIGNETPPQALNDACEALSEAGKWRFQLAGRQGKRIYNLQELPSQPTEPIAGLIQVANHVCSSLPVCDFGTALNALDTLGEMARANLYRCDQLQQALRFVASSVAAAVEESALQRPEIGAQWSAHIEHLASASDLIAAMRQQVQRIHEESTGASAHPLIARVFELTQRHYNQPLNLESLAQRLNISAKYLGQLFIAETGAKYSDYLRGVRVQKAQTLLAQTSMSVLQIAREVGIPDEKYFQRVFKAKVGLSPGEFARAHRRG